MSDPNFGGSRGSFIDANNYVSYYSCREPDYPCPPDIPGWTKKLESLGQVGSSYGFCGDCAVTKITWTRIGTQATVKKVKFSYSTFINNGEQNYKVGWTIDGVYKEYGTTTVDNINKNYGGSVDKYLYENGIKYGHFSATDTIYSVNGNLYNPTTSPVVPPAGCTEGKTRQVICPKNGKLIIQNCIGNAWVTIKADETKCLSGGEIGLTQFIVTLIIVIIIFYFISRR